MTRDDDLRIRIGRIRDTDSRRAKPFIARALAAAEKAGGFTVDPDGAPGAAPSAAAALPASPPLG